LIRRVWPLAILATGVLIAGCASDPAVAFCSEMIPKHGGHDHGGGHQRVFVAAGDGAAIEVFSLDNFEHVATIPVGAGPGEVYATADGDTVWAVSTEANLVTFIDSQSLEVVRIADVGAKPVHSFLSPNGSKLWIGNDGS